MADFLLELRCEEIPARMQAGARAELEKLFRRELEAAGVAAGDLTIWSTPRRLALIARGLPLATDAVSEEAKGPPEGAPDAAIDGFCKKAGVARDALELRDVKGRMTYFAVIEQPGRAMADVLMTVQVLQRFGSDLAQHHGITHTDHALWCKLQTTPKHAIPAVLHRLGRQSP